MFDPAPDSLERAERPGWLDALLLGLTLLPMLIGLGNYGLYEPHEGHFAGVGREMLLRGDWIVPHLNGAHYLNKPPLLYWMVALSYSIFGINEWAARLPLAIIGFSSVVLAWQWAREMWGLRAGRIAAGLLMASTGWFLFGHQLMIDLLLSGLYFANLYALWKALLKPHSVKRWLVVYFILGLSVMAKGPVAILFYGIIFGGYAIFIQRDWSLLIRCRPLYGILVLLAITLPWAWAVNQRVPGVLEYMIVNENLKRVVDQRWPPDYSVVKVSPLVFLVVAMIWLAPWSLLLPPVILNTRERAKGGGGRERMGVWILALGALVPMIVFLPMPSRLIYYCLPTVPAFAVLAAGWWNASDEDEKKISRIVVGALFALVGAVIFSAAFWVPPLLKNIPDLLAAPATVELIDDMAMLLGTSIFLGGVLLLAKRVGIAALVLMAGIGFSCVYTSSGFVAFDAVRSSRNLVRAVDSKLGTSAIWVSEGSKEIGATAGIAYYLKSDDPKNYRTVLIMEDDKRRPPPAFPPPKPKYLIDMAKLNEIWKGDVPVVFVTDFQRQKWTPEEAPYLPDNAGEPVPLEGTGFRKLYANEAARKKLGLK